MNRESRASQPSRLPVAATRRPRPLATCAPLLLLPPRLPPLPLPRPSPARLSPLFVLMATIARVQWDPPSLGLRRTRLSSIVRLQGSSLAAVLASGGLGGLHPLPSCWGMLRPRRVCRCKLLARATLGLGHCTSSERSIVGASSFAPTACITCTFIAAAGTSFRKRCVCSDLFVKVRAGTISSSRR